MLTNWFQSGLKQGDTLSPTLFGLKEGDTLFPTLFGIVINDIVKEINDFNLGVKIGNKKVSILLYADDIVLLSDIENGLQAMLNVHKWWQNVMIHFMGKCLILYIIESQTLRTSKQLFLGECVLSVVKNQYKYLCVILNQFVNFNVIDILSGAANRALGIVISKYKHINGLGYYTYTTLYKWGLSNCGLL